MPLVPVFNQFANPREQALETKAAGYAAQSPAPVVTKEVAKRKPPFGLRLSDAERSRLVADANGMPIGTYIKERLFYSEPSGRKRRKGLSIQDREAFARALALLGRAHLSSNLNQLAHAVNIGVLPATPETEAELFAALQDVRTIRRLLMTALGHRLEDQP